MRILLAAVLAVVAVLGVIIVVTSLAMQPWKALIGMAASGAALAVLVALAARR